MDTEIVQKRKPSFNDNLERLRIVTGTENEYWLDLLKLNWRDYVKVRANLIELPENSLLNLANHFEFSPDSFLLGNLDFQDLQIRSEQKNWKLPNKYARATHGKARSTITAFDYLEKMHGWQIRYEILKQLELSESILTNPFDPISMQVLSDTLNYLSKRHFGVPDFFSMGIYSHIENTKTFLGEHYAKLKNPREIIEHMIGECLQYYEKNCKYNFIKVNDYVAVVEVLSEPAVAEEMGVLHLGNEPICHAKAGWFASTPLYLGLPPLKVVQTSCVHRGDPACRYEISFTSYLDKTQLF